MLLCEKKVMDAKFVYQGNGWESTTITTNGITTVYVCRNGVCIKLGSYQSFYMEGK